MPEKTSKYLKTGKHSRSANTQSRAVSRTKAAFQNLPEKQKEVFSLQEAIHQLRAPIEAALTKGYSHQEVAAMLQQQGILISGSTLRNYLSSGRPQASKKRASNKLSGKSSKKLSEAPNSAVEVFIPSRTGMSSYTVGRDFWNVYQESLREREEVYRRLAES